MLFVGCDFLDTGRFVKVSYPKVPRALSGGSTGDASSGPSSGGVRPVGCKTVFVKNLPYEVTEEQIRQVFMVCGPIVTVRLATWGHTGSQKGFCYVDFKREDSAEIAGILLYFCIYISMTLDSDSKSKKRFILSCS